MQKFDLNIKKILDDWTISDAVREIISNAIDEQHITETQDIKIYQNGVNWIIEDYGRGLKEEHFSQNESLEKKKHKGVIGKFGIGLKDAISVLFRKKINFKIQTRDFATWPELHKKEGSSLVTIHMMMNKSAEKFSGTKFIIENISDVDMEIAKSNFLLFNQQKVVMKNEYGEMLKTEKSIIYVNGMQIAESNEYLFSYNITKINKKLSEKMNRERKSIGKEAYSGIIEKILSDNMPEHVANILFENNDCGEMRKKKTRTAVLEIINKQGRHVFVTKKQLMNMTPHEKEMIEKTGREIRVIEDVDGNMNLYGIDDAYREYNDNFKFKVINENDLNRTQKINYQKCNKILRKLNRKLYITIVERENLLNEDVLGYWTAQNAFEIYIVQMAFSNFETSLKTLIHEYAHSLRGSYDSSRNFEDDLSDAWYKYANLDFN